MYWIPSLGTLKHYTKQADKIPVDFVFRAGVKQDIEST
jgi:hypothetical protein